MKKKPGKIAFKVGHTIMWATPIPEGEARAANERITKKTQPAIRDARRVRAHATVNGGKIVITC